jgi:hypothetical protein
VPHSLAVLNNSINVYALRKNAPNLVCVSQVEQRWSITA